MIMDDDTMMLDDWPDGLAGPPSPTVWLGVV